MTKNDKGASAILITIAVGFLLLGMAALAIDVGAGFNERRQDQSAADASVMAGGLEASFLTTNADLVDEALAYARSNLPTTYTDPEWQALWQGCTDANRPINFFRMPDPWGGAGALLNCISRSPSFIRVRIPNQILDSSFGTFVGVNQLNVNAFAVAKIGPASLNAPIVPYGISATAGPGELCLGNSPLGIAYPPCNGPSSGSFGAILSEQFGEFYGAVDCGNPGVPQISLETALGVDHFVATFPAGAGATLGDPHPGDGYILGLGETRTDTCTESGGIAVADDGVPLNTMKVDSGFSNGQAYEDGLVSDLTFFGQPSRLQQGTNPTRDIVARRTGANEEIWELDNVGPWDYIAVGHAGIGACAPGQFGSSISTDVKVANFSACVAAYVASGTATDLLTTDVDDSPRFAWAPQYWYEFSTTGLSWQPVFAYRMVFIGGTWFNCTAGVCAVTFYPDSDQTAEMCDPIGGSNCAQLSLDQFSAWFLPDDSVPDEIRNTFPGGQTPFKPSLWR